MFGVFSPRTHVFITEIEPTTRSERKKYKVKGKKELEKCRRRRWLETEAPCPNSDLIFTEVRPIFEPKENSFETRNAQIN